MTLSFVKLKLLHLLHPSIHKTINLNIFVASFYSPPVTSMSMPASSRYHFHYTCLATNLPRSQLHHLHQVVNSQSIPISGLNFKTPITKHFHHHFWVKLECMRRTCQRLLYNIILYVQITCSIKAPTEILF